MISTNLFIVLLIVRANNALSNRKVGYLSGREGVCVGTGGGNIVISFDALIVNINDDIRCLNLTYQRFELVAVPVQTSISSVNRVM